MARTNMGRSVCSALILFVWLVAGCNKGGEEPLTMTPPPAAAQGELRLWLQSAVITLDPNLSTFANDASVIAQLFRGLLWYDEKLNLIPMAAKEVPSPKNKGISVDGLVYTFRLRDGLKWSDGQPLTALDFEYSFKRLLDPTVRAQSASTFFDIKGAEAYNSAKTDSEPASLAKLRDEVGVKAMNDKTLVVTLRSPRATFLHLVTFSQVNPVHQGVIEKYGDQWTSAANFIGNGPFVLKEAVLNQQIVLTPNPHWMLDKPKLTQVTFHVITDTKAAFEAYLAGELDYVGVTPDSLSAVGNDADLKKQNVQIPQLSSVALMFNNTAPPFDNRMVRQAFSMAVDREFVLAQFQPGGALAGLTWIPPTMAGYNKNAGQQWRLNPGKAKSLLSEAGYPGGQGLPPITFYYTAVQQPLAQVLQQQLEQNLGVRISTELVDIAASRQRLLTGEYQIISSGRVGVYGDPETFLSDVYGCQLYAADKCSRYASANRAFYANPEFDRLMSEALKELDDGRRSKLYMRAESIMIEDAPAVFLGYALRNALVKPYVRGLVYSPAHKAVIGDNFLERVYIAVK